VGKEQSVPNVLFNASVVLAGLKSPMGGSGKLLQWANQKKITGIISEVILDEIRCNINKAGLNKKSINKIVTTFPKVLPAPKKSTVISFYEVVIDYGDAHVLASALEADAQFLVTFDKKHLLSLQNKVKMIEIVSPKQLIKILSEK